MNAQNAHEYLPLVQALADGKTIQVYDTLMGWVDREDFVFGTEPSDYRIKPEPRTFYVWVCVDPYYEWVVGDKRLDKPLNAHLKCWERITVQEVLK
jgi:hypothetical protein